MTPAARIQAGIEILDRVIEGAKSNGAPADRIMAEWARGNRYAGSKDRRAVRELVFAAIRACGPVPASGRAAMLRLAAHDDSLRGLFDGSTYGPAPIGEREKAAPGGIAPDWLIERLEGSGMEESERAALMDRAPLDVRVNTLKADRDTLDLPALGKPLALPQAIRFPPGTGVEQWQQFRDGLVEVQDLGSQIACLAADVRPGETVVDLCAGAGGKTLALAAAMQNEGTLIASDTDRGRLSKLDPRARRAGAGMIQTVLLDPGREPEMLEPVRGHADCVLVDAPCSGTGTLRRKPEAKWRLSPDALDRYTAAQDRLLDIAATLVRPGGRIVFVTCSVLDAEGAQRMDAFLDRHPEWNARPMELPLGRRRGKGTRLTPFHDGTDGFFIARAGLAC